MLPPPIGPLRIIIRKSDPRNGIPRLPLEERIFSPSIPHSPYPADCTLHNLEGQVGTTGEWPTN